MIKDPVFTIDVEDWRHSANLSPYLPLIRSSHSSVPMTEQLLRILGEKKARGTFFVLGVIGERYPELIEKIVDAGHEIASHGWDHRLITGMSEFELARDLEKSKELLSKVAKKEVVGYRSPCFSQNKFLGGLLLDLGFSYTSIGISSSFHDRYANNDYENEALPDFPLPVAEFAGLKIPATGGGWFRLFPVWLQKLLIKNTNQETKVFYCHPWDFDPNQKGLENIPKIVRWRHMVNNRISISKLRRFNFHHSPLRSCLNTVTSTDSANKEM